MSILFQTRQECLDCQALSSMLSALPQNHSVRASIEPIILANNDELPDCGALLALFSKLMVEHHTSIIQ